MKLLLGTLAAGLILAAISSITYVAYKHPAGYRRLSVLIMALSWAGALLFVGFDLGFVRATAVHLHDSLAADSTRTLSSVRYSIDSLYNFTTPIWRVGMIWGLLSVYLFFLGFLPTILGLGAKPDAK